jgi:hypothetical protein
MVSIPGREAITQCRGVVDYHDHRHDGIVWRAMLSSAARICDSRFSV